MNERMNGNHGGSMEPYTKEDLDEIMLSLMQKRRDFTTASIVLDDPKEQDYARSIVKRLDPVMKKTAAMLQSME